MKDRVDEPNTNTFARVAEILPSLREIFEQYLGERVIEHHCDDKGVGATFSALETIQLCSRELSRAVSRHELQGMA
jgi:hypothetical protein